MGILIIEMLTSENPLRGENRRESEYLTKHKVRAQPWCEYQCGYQCGYQQ